MKTWYFSDPHFGHDNIYKFTVDGPPDGEGRTIRYPYMNAAEGDKILVNWHNLLVQPEDFVWHLGDVAWSKKDLETVKQLNGKRGLIFGNHDECGHEAYLDAGFNKFASYIKDKQNRLIFSHIPLHETSIPKGFINVHGHTHDKNLMTGKHLNISVEQTDFKPITLNQILFAAELLRAKHDSKMG